MNNEVDQFIQNQKRWREEFIVLRDYMHETQLTEEFKWRTPCYTHNGNNILLLGAFKEYCSLSFVKGVLLSDPNKVLISPGPNSQAVMYLKFHSVEEIEKLKQAILSFVYEAIEVEKVGLKTPSKTVTKNDWPEELNLAFEEDPMYLAAFESLTPGRQRGYLLQFNGPKKPETRTARIEKNRQRIMDGFGFHDCVCGLSKRMPNCDGSHKNI